MRKIRLLPAVAAVAACLAAGCAGSFSPWPGGAPMAPVGSGQSGALTAPTNQAKFQAGSATKKPPELSHNPLAAAWHRMFGSSKPSPTSPFETSAPADVLSLSRKPKPAGPDLYIAMARMSEQAGNVGQAATQYEHAIKLDPKSVDALRGYAHLEDRQGNFDQAVALYQRAIQANPKHAGARNDLGLCLARAGRLQESAAALAQAVELQPERPLYRNNLATVLAEQGDSDGALAQWTATQGAAIAHYNLARLLQRRGQRQQAVDHLQTALQLDRNLSKARDALAQLTPAPTQTAVRPAGLPHVSPSAGDAAPIEPNGRIAEVRAAAENPAESPAWQTPGAVSAWATDQARAADVPPVPAAVGQSPWPVAAGPNTQQMPPTPNQVYSYPTSATPDASPVFPPQYQ